MVLVKARLELESGLDWLTFAEFVRLVDAWVLAPLFRSMREGRESLPTPFSYVYKGASGVTISIEIRSI